MLTSWRKTLKISVFQRLSRKEVTVKGKICFIVLSVILAVSLGYTSDISAYTYRVKAQTGARNGNETMIVTSNLSTDRSKEIDIDLLEDASETVEVLIAEAKAEAEPVVMVNDIQVGAAEGIHENISEEETAEETYEEPVETEVPAETEETSEEAEPTAEAEEVVSEPEEAEETVSSVDESEIDILRRIVMAEAGCEDIQGQIMVANVILNRIAAGYGETISDIVFAPGQFSPVETGSIWTVVPTEQVIEACNRALAGEDYSYGAIFFVSPYGDTSWFYSDCEFVTEHGGHLFFK